MVEEEGAAVGVADGLGGEVGACGGVGGEGEDFVVILGVGALGHDWQRGESREKLGIADKLDGGGGVVCQLRRSPRRQLATVVALVDNMMCVA